MSGILDAVVAACVIGFLAFEAHSMPQVATAESGHTMVASTITATKQQDEPTNDDAGRKKKRDSGHETGTAESVRGHPYPYI
eukprot:scaffold626566_cov45-Prasinocladus_malaysianus.AAC.1